MPATSSMTLRNVLVPTDLSPCAERAFVPAAALALRHGAAVSIVQVTTIPSAPARGVVTRIDGPHIGDQAFDLVPVIDIDVEASDEAEAIVEQARRTEADVIVMGTNGRSGLSRLRLGSVAQAVARAAPCPVLLVHPDVELADWQVDRVLVAIDPDDLDAADRNHQVPEPAQRAADWASTFGAHLDLVTVSDGTADRGYPSLRRCAADLLALTVRLAHGDPAPPSVDYAVRQGDPVEVIIAEAKRSTADLIVVGTQRRGLRRWVLGSVAEGIARQALCPVLVVLPRMAAMTQRSPDLLNLAFA